MSCHHSTPPEPCREFLYCKAGARDSYGMKETSSPESGITTFAFKVNISGAPGESLNLTRISLTTEPFRDVARRRREIVPVLPGKIGIRV